MPSIPRPKILSLILALALPACAVPADDAPGADDSASAPNTGEAASEVLVTGGHWSGISASFAQTWQGAQVGSINGRTFVLTAGTCGDWQCFAGYDLTSLGSHEYLGGNFSYWYNVPNQSTHDKVSLAAFNGYLYMAHMGGSDDDQHTTWLSRYDPATNTWTPDHTIAYPTNDGPPALAVLNNRLYFIGTSNVSPYAMWYGSMDTNENFSAMAAIPGHQTQGRISATAAFGQIFFAHRWGQTTDLVYGTFNGTAWSPVNHIYGGTNNSAIQGYEAALAYDGSRLHLVHTRPNDTYVWWTQFDNCHWSTTESQIGGIQSDLPPSLAAGGPGLMLLTDNHDQHWYDVAYAAWTPPSMPTRCLVNQR